MIPRRRPSVLQRPQKVSLARVEEGGIEMKEGRQEGGLASIADQGTGLSLPSQGSSTKRHSGIKSKSFQFFHDLAARSGRVWTLPAVGCNPACGCYGGLQPRCVCCLAVCLSRGGPA